MSSKAYRGKQDLAMPESCLLLDSGQQNPSAAPADAQYASVRKIQK